MLDELLGIIIHRPTLVCTRLLHLCDGVNSNIGITRIAENRRAALPCNKIDILSLLTGALDGISNMLKVPQVVIVDIGAGDPGLVSPVSSTASGSLEEVLVPSTVGHLVVQRFDRADIVVNGLASPLLVGLQVAPGEVDKRTEAGNVGAGSDLEGVEKSWGLRHGAGRFCRGMFEKIEQSSRKVV